MGSQTSRFHIYEEVPEVRPYRSTFEALQLTEKDVGRLYKLFRKITGDNNTEVDRNNLLDFLDVDRNPFTLRVFSIFDEDNSGSVDFREFVISAWNYCTLGNTTLALFAFDLYDRDNSGDIGAEEVEMMLRDIYGRKYKTNLHATRIAEKLEIMKCIEFDKDVFRDFVFKHPNMLYPVFEMQKQIKKSIMGIRYWDEYSARRVEMCDGKYLSIAQIIKLLNEKKIQEKLKQSEGEGVADVVDFEALLTTEKESKWYEKKKLDRDIYIKGSVVDTESAHKLIAERKEKEAGGIKKSVPKAKPSCWDSFTRVLCRGGAVAVTESDPDDFDDTGTKSEVVTAKDVSATSASSARSSSKKGRAAPPSRADSIASTASERGGKGGSSIKDQKSKENINVLADSFGLVKRRQKASLSSSKNGSADFSEDNDETEVSIKSKKHRGSGNSLSPSCRKASRGASASFSDADHPPGDERTFGKSGEELGNHRKLQYGEEEIITVNGHGGGALSYEEAVAASAKAKAARREQTERAKMRSLAEGKGKKGKKK